MKPPPDTNLGALELRLAENVTSQDFLELQFAAFGKKLSERWFHWFNHDCPLGRSRIFVAVDPDSGQLMASVGFLPLQIAWRGKPVQGSTYVNAMTRPAAQRRNLNVALLARAVAHSREFGDLCSITFPAAHRASLPGMLKTGWTVYSDIHIWKLMRRPIARATTTRRIARFDPSIDDFLQGFYGKMDFAVWKDHRFLNWRVCDRPDQAYEIHMLGEASAPRGFVVLKHYRDDSLGKTHIVELVAHDDDAFDRLVQTAETRAVEQQSDVLNTWALPGDIYAANLSARGFEKTQEHNTLARHVAGALADGPAGGRHHISLIDNDVY